MKRVEFMAGKTIFDQADRGQHCYQIVSGSVEIRLTTRDADGHKDTQLLQRMGFGQVFGEMSVIAGTQRTAAAVAVEPTVCVAYTADEFVNMLESDAKEALDYIRVLIERIRHTNDMVLKQAMRG